MAGPALGAVVQAQKMNTIMFYESDFVGKGIRVLEPTHIYLGSLPPIPLAFTCKKRGLVNYVGFAWRVWDKFDWSVFCCEMPCKTYVLKKFDQVFSRL